MLDNLMEWQVNLERSTNVESSRLIKQHIVEQNQSQTIKIAVTTLMLVAAATFLIVMYRRAKKD